MKKRAVLTAVASLALAGAMCFAFAACGETESVEEKIEKIKGEEVTEEVWNSVFGLDVYSDEIYGILSEMYPNFKIECRDNAGGAGGPETKREIVFSDGKSYMKEVVTFPESMEMPDDFGEVPYDKTGEREWTAEAYFDHAEKATYIRQNGKWSVVTSEGGDGAIEWLVTMIAFGKYGGDFSSYRYDSESKEYISEKEGMLSTVKFADGKLRSVVCEMKKQEDGNSVFEMFFLTYGGQSVKFPAVG